MHKVYDAQAQPLHKKFTTRHLLGVGVWILFSFSCFFYLFAAIVTGDVLWFRPSPFAAQPAQFTVVKQGQERVIRAGDPQFTALRDAFNATINQGYEGTTIGFSDVTWDELQRNSYYIDATYAQPVLLERQGVPAYRLRVLIDGAPPETAGLLFTHGSQAWARTPQRLTTVDPIVQVLKQDDLYR
jgi:hypothetical protein